VAVVTLNRPERMNAWTGVMHAEVKAAMREAADDAAVRVIVLTGAGRGFCAGADMNTLQGIQSGGSGSDTAEAPFDPASNPNFQKTYSYFPAVPKPIIGAINGACAGLGMVIALYCDIRLASDAAVFTTAFSRRGLIAEHGISWLLPRLVGIANAADLLYSRAGCWRRRPRNSGWSTACSRWPRSRPR
jgi:enoyl-CoA hydratase/carnithine racemase